MIDITQQSGIETRITPQSLGYILRPPIALFTTGLKVLKSQEKTGFVHCYLVHYNGLPKLVYNISGYTSFEELAQSLQPGSFLALAGHILDTLFEIRSIGFVQLRHILVGAARIYIDPQNNKPYFVYLPLEGEINAPVYAITEELRETFLTVIHSAPCLQAGPVQELEVFLQRGGFSFEQLAAEVKRLSASYATGGLHNGALQTGAMPAEPTDETGLPEQPPPLPVEKTAKKGLFSRVFAGKPKAARKKEAPPALQIEESGATEVLNEIFVPGYVLAGVKTPQKIELLITKPRFIIGKKAEAVDGLISFNNAVSREHCLVICDDNDYFLEDLGSANGTFLNGERLQPNQKQPLKAGDKIKLANTSFIFKSV